ncbi:hypothetical protein EAI26_03850 [Lactobacillus sp. 0.1XD8-4]|uniref:hypothetical protein n=1 Tax=uncultured Limosilactobacillus sp. TaxID=2837629 RepID=UPI00129E8EF5|nr:hypothetical protein [uncultured Limosilactobacillus sp.]MRN06531.1 hypothetical protein [Lactobacillus sp. 0.1XD8-4]
MNTDSFQKLTDWLKGRHYTLKQDGPNFVLSQQGHELAIITPPDKYQVKNIEMTFDEWVEFNKCIRNIRHYLIAQKKSE